MAQRSVPAPFLTKTYQLVDDPETNDVVSWNDNGTAFVVWKTADFARDLLPKYFKHNNFSSFVRQLNTYGFRKVVPDKWEFANENFRRAQKQLLSDIRRRKATTSPAAQADKRHPEISATPSVSAGDDLGSTSTSLQPDPKSSAGSAPAQVADLSGENEKLKKDNAVLSTELAQTKRQCDELIAFLTKYVNVGPDQIDRIMREGTVVVKGHDRDEYDEKVDDEEKEGVKLFGVWVINRKRKKMDGCDEKGYSGGPRGKEMKGVDFHAPPLMVKIGGEVCN